MFIFKLYLSSFICSYFIGKASFVIRGESSFIIKYIYILTFLFTYPTILRLIGLIFSYFFFDKPVNDFFTIDSLGDKTDAGCINYHGSRKRKIY